MMDYLKADEVQAFTELHNWAVHNGVSYRIEYEESTNYWEAETISNAPSENVYVRMFTTLRSAVDEMMRLLGEQISAAREKKAKVTDGG